ncbi:protein kinase [Hamiltosporidium tvaerminnensis]|uniref:Protein kinase n=1 Tax=Hamiltosporidium tvaerminnensis TaxID=1176355 RepID=A0A4Q9M4L3_9MICR|nr:protein kinase [Hamiltosporidium tvaerminnensis]
MENIFTNKDLLIYIRKKFDTNISETQRLACLFAATQKNLSPDTFGLEIWIMYITMLSCTDDWCDINNIFQVIKRDYYKYTKYWKEYFLFCKKCGDKVFFKAVKQSKAFLDSKEFNSKNEILNILENIINNRDVDSDIDSDKGSNYKGDNRDDNKGIDTCKYNGDTVMDNGTCKDRGDRVMNTYNSKGHKESNNESYNNNMYYRNIKYKNAALNAYSKDCKITDKTYNDINYIYNSVKENYKDNNFKGENKGKNLKGNACNINNPLNNKIGISDINTPLNNDIRVSDINTPLNNDIRVSNINIPLNNSKNHGNIKTPLVNNVNIPITNTPLNVHMKVPISNTPLVTNIRKNNFKENQRGIPVSVDIKNPCDLNITANLNALQGKVPQQEYDNTIYYIDNMSLKVIRQIKRGGSSVVYQVLCNKEIFALKEIKITDKNDSLSKEYKNEIFLLQKFKKSNEIIKLINYKITDTNILILLEYGETDLSDVIRNTKKLSINFIRYIWEQMLLIVEKVHDSRIVHRDIKPANFVFVKGHLKLIDFGISKIIRPETTTVFSENAAGTFYYLAPEVLNNRDKKIKRSADIWSLGCILYEMVYGNPPLYNEKHVTDILCRLNDSSLQFEYKFINESYESVIDVIKGCLVYQPEKRKSLKDLIDMRFLKIT